MNSHSSKTEEGAGTIGYDFIRPVNISRKFKQNLTTVGESLAKQLAFNLSNLLRTNVEVGFRSVEQALFSDYMRSFDKPSCIGIFSALPLKGQAVMAIDSEIMFVMLDKLEGGPGNPPYDIGDFTEIETRIFRTILGRILADFKEAAKRIVDLKVSLSRLESNPGFINVMTSGEKTIFLKLELSMGGCSGKMTLCFSKASFDPVMDKFDPKEEMLDRKLENIDGEREMIASAIEEASIEIVAELGCARLSLRELMGLKVGDTLLLDHIVSAPVRIKVGNTVLFTGEPGKSQNRKAVKILEEVQRRR